jgi:hypothetical protein
VGVRLGLCIMVLSSGRGRQYPLSFTLKMAHVICIEIEQLSLTGSFFYRCTECGNSVG